MKSCREAESTIGSDSEGSSWDEIEEVSLGVGSGGTERENGSRDDAELCGKGEAGRVGESAEDESAERGVRECWRGGGRERVKVRVERMVRSLSVESSNSGSTSFLPSPPSFSSSASAKMSSSPIERSRTSSIDPPCSISSSSRHLVKSPGESDCLPFSGSFLLIELFRLKGE